MAVVYEVEHLKLGVHYALKTFTLQEGHVELFRKRFGSKWKAVVAAVVAVVLGVGCWLYWRQSGSKTIRTDDLLAIPAAAPEG